MKKERLKILAVSDTHKDLAMLDHIAQNQAGDIFIHAGDFTYYGDQYYFKKFFQFIDQLKFKHKVVISGNHEISLDNGCIDNQNKKQYLSHYPCKLQRQQIVKKLKQKCHYLEHQSIEIQGINIFGSPYTQLYLGSAFQYDPKYQKEIWDYMPAKVDILVTHSPPYGILDINSKGKHCGSKYLTKIVKDRKPKIHIFGHIHEGRGNLKQDQIIFLNAAHRIFKFLY